MPASNNAKPGVKRRRRMAREPEQLDSMHTDQSSDAGAPPPDALRPRDLTKICMVLALLSRSEGATLDQMMEATGWLRHTTRAALTGLKKKGHDLSSTKVEDVRTYRIAAKAEDTESSSGGSAKAES
ncbi:DUF3489 domain-containing protein [Parablastomonas sp. CN1-191]|uniref:DUF3489 domain-containing protein n=1 Tax=Parablastomonas sp. CN1-191 TaxID=3400908 RepID=UPI003BF892DE